MCSVTIYNKYDKSKIASLPLVAFPGRIFTITTEIEAKKAVDFLLKESVLGIDTETKPSFKKGTINTVGLLQVSTLDTCFLFRLNLLGMTESIKRFLEDTTVPKIGLSLRDDISGLKKLGDFTPGLYYDLQKHVQEIGIEDLSLQKLYANIFGQKISKRQQLSNWNAEILNDKQKIYAATDAWACVMLYNRIQALLKDKNYKLLIVNEVKDDTPETEERG